MEMGKLFAGLFKGMGTVLLKESTEDQRYLERLKELKEQSSGEAGERIHRALAGMEERLVLKEQILQVLAGSGLDMIVLNGLVFSQEGTEERLDFYVITPKVQFLIQCRETGASMEETEAFFGRFRRQKLQKASGLQRVGLETRFDQFYKCLAVSGQPEEGGNQEASSVREATVETFLSVMEKINADSSVSKLSRKEMRRAGDRLLERWGWEEAYYQELYEGLKGSV